MQREKNALQRKQNAFNFYGINIKVHLIGDEGLGWCSFSVVVCPLILEVASILNIVSLCHPILDNSDTVSKIESALSDSTCDATLVIILCLSMFLQLNSIHLAIPLILMNFE